MGSAGWPIGSGHVYPGFLCEIAELGHPDLAVTWPAALAARQIRPTVCTNRLSRQLSGAARRVSGQAHQYLGLAAFPQGRPSSLPG